MSSKSIDICDRCKVEAESDEAKKILGLMKIVVGREARYNSYSYTKEVYKIDPWEGEWCLACCKELRVDKILPYKDPNLPPVEQRPSLEEMIREIVREELP